MSMQATDRYWQAVLDRNIRYDTEFVYAVTSTGIYCRPSCPSRRPHRDKVLFFPASDAAEQAHFRPCKRCQPQDALRQDHALIERMCEMLIATERTPPLTEMAEILGFSPYHIQRLFKKVIGITPHQYAQEARMRRVKEQLRQKVRVTDALYEAGYGSSSRLYERSTAQLGMTPARYQRGGRGMRIMYTIVDSSLGRLLIAATTQGISAVCLGNTDAELEQGLYNEYPEAELCRETSGPMNEWVTEIILHLQGKQPQLDHVPLDIRGTAFQWKVRQLLQAIPYGSTCSYSELAYKLGQPTATRAVARVCATNPVALVIPCHRIVRHNGDLGGYRWGLARKQALLEQERGESRDQV